MILNLSYLVKFRGISYLHCQWLNGFDIVVNFNLSSI